MRSHLPIKIFMRTNKNKLKVDKIYKVSNPVWSRLLKQYNWSLFEAVNFTILHIYFRISVVVWLCVSRDQTEYNFWRKSNFGVGWWDWFLRHKCAMKSAASLSESVPLWIPTTMLYELILFHDVRMKGKFWKKLKDSDPPPLLLFFCTVQQVPFMWSSFLRFLTSLYYMLTCTDLNKMGNFIS